ncbi:hypothetical protein QR78_26930 [Methylobacterium indicum]|uniref:PPM-type phosphatase domain-containing protein n=3 Tax=Methylobacterium indicum TaxID=1775910 RepID=A0ABR5GNT1_9HYPH|nr:hypothetical protein QR79_31015 [Methylobacterium indicum]KMO12621.1 hypothetical protein QR78_26930 [Methylobacterium indicum]
MTGRRPAAAPEPAMPGLFGKVPSRGDFVSRRLGGALHGALDQWLSRAIVASRRQLGEAWLPAYLVAPVWRFVLGRDTMGPHAVAGVLMPSVDRVGRYFPLVLAAEMPDLADPWRLFRRAGTWFDAAEARARACLADDFDFDAFEAGLTALGLPEPPHRPVPDGAEAPRRYGLGGEAEAIRAYADVLEAAMAGSRRSFTLWWTTGSEAVAPSLLMHGGAPAPEQFAAFLDGRWDVWGWQDWARQDGPGPGQADREARAPVLPPADAPLAPAAAPEPVRLVSAARTHRGTRRQRNDDAVVDRPDLGLWAVADGAGGHAAADVAAAAVAERLAGLPAGPEAPGRGAIEALLAQANEALRARARRLGPDAVVAAVVVVLMVRAGRYAVAWAGDARAYLLRGRGLLPLTRDHATREGRKVVTRAVGAEDAFALDWVDGAVRAGDRFVLCSDGLVGALGERGLALVAGHGTPAEAVASAIDDALIAGARDNVSVVVVDAAGAGSEAR